MDSLHRLRWILFTPGRGADHVTTDQTTAMPAVDGPVPVPTPETAPFWAACLEGELHIQHCNACGRYYFYPRPFCRYCASPDVEWRRVSGGGHLVSYVINHRPWPPAPDAPHQVVALVQLDEGPRLLTNIVGCTPTPENLPLDARVVVDFMPRGDQALPVFRLEDQS